MTGAVLVVVAVSLLAPARLQAQRTPQPPAPAPSRRAATAPPRTELNVPFKAGETLTYDVSWSAYLTAGTAVTTVKEKRPSFDSTAYYIVAEGRPTPLLGNLYSLYYKMDTLIDSYTLLPQRGSMYSEEGSRHRLRTTTFDRAAHQVSFEYQANDTITDRFAVPPSVQDGLSVVYLLRSMPLKTGDRQTVPVTHNGSNLSVQVEVGPIERLKLPFGEASAWKLQLTVRDAAGTEAGRNVALWISNDDRRLPVRLQAELAVGSFNLNLREAR